MAGNARKVPHFVKVALVHSEAAEALRLERWLLAEGHDVQVVTDISGIEARVDLVVMEGALMQPQGGLVVPPYAFNLASREVTLADRAVALTSLEYELAVLLFRRFGQPLSRVELAERVWKRVSLEDSRTLDAHMSKLRRKLQLVPAHGVRLVSLYGFGYCLQRAGPPPVLRSPPVRS
jgi:two-component system OmpR family response regulator